MTLFLKKIIMRNNIIIFLTLLSIFGCKSNVDSSEFIYTTITPIKFFADQIVGDSLTVKVLVPNGISPETYSPSPKKIQEISGASTYLMVGSLGFEMGGMDRLNELNPDMDIVDLSQGIDLIKTVAERHGDHYHYGVDPHIWLSPNEVKVIVNNIYSAVVKLKPDSELFFKENRDRLIADIDSLHLEIKDRLKSASAFAIYHPTLGYFAREFNLEQYSVESDGKAPSVTKMVDLVDNLNRLKIKTVLIQAEFNQESARSLADEIDGDVKMIETLNYDWFNQMRGITNAIAE